MESLDLHDFEDAKSTDREGGRERELSRIRFGETRLLKGNVEFDHFKGLVRRSWAPLKKVEEEEKDCGKIMYGCSIGTMGVEIILIPHLKRFISFN